MRRSRLKPRSEKNSRKWENVALRRQYLEDNPTCELSRLLKRNGLDIGDDSADPHHIIGGAGRRVDAVSNLVTVCRPVHDWIHANPPDGRIVCLWVKLQKGELDAVQFHSISGWFLAGWLDANRPQIEWVAPLWRDLVDVVSH